MKTAVLQVRLDGKLKKEADTFFDKAGLDTTTAVRLFLRQSLIQNKIPFPIVGKDPFHAKENQKVLRASIRRLEAGEGVARELIDA